MKHSKIMSFVCLMTAMVIFLAGCATDAPPLAEPGESPSLAEPGESPQAEPSETSENNLETFAFPTEAETWPAEIHFATDHETHTVDFDSITAVLSNKAEYPYFLHHIYDFKLVKQVGSEWKIVPTYGTGWRDMPTLLRSGQTSDFIVFNGTPDRNSPDNTLYANGLAPGVYRIVPAPISLMRQEGVGDSLGTPIWSGMIWAEFEIVAYGDAFMDTSSAAAFDNAFLDALSPAMDALSTASFYEFIGTFSGLWACSEQLDSLGEAAAFEREELIELHVRVQLSALYSLYRSGVENADDWLEETYIDLSAYGDFWIKFNHETGNEYYYAIVDGELKQIDVGFTPNCPEVQVIRQDLLSPHATVFANSMS